MNPAARLLLLGAASLTALGLMLPGGASRSPHTTPDEAAELTIYCAASLRLPVEQIAQAYERECGVKPRIHYGGSNTLLSQIEVSRTGDLYLAADESFLRFGEQKGLVAEVSVLGQMRAVLAVPRGNPLAIASLDDLQTRRVAAGNPDQTAIGRTLCNQLQASGSWKPLERRVREAGVFKPTVNEVANDILLGSVDAGVVWDAIASQYPEIDIVEVPELQSETTAFGVGLLTCAQDASAARRFVRYLAAKDRGLRVFEENGYGPVAGEPWSPAAVGTSQEEP